MKKIIFLVLVCIFLISCSSEKEKSLLNKDQTPVTTTSNEIISQDYRFTLNSDTFVEGGIIPAKYTCKGENVNPQLKWNNPPENTKSFALIVDDPDAPGGNWIHWLVKDIPVDIEQIEEDSVEGVGVTNSFGKKEYGGPCPPSGTHRYFFKLFALDVESIQAETIKEFNSEVEKHKINEAVLIGKFSK